MAAVLRKCRTLLAAGFAASLVVLVAPVGSAPANAGTPTPYYLALGDSLAQGVQPNASGQDVATNQGYADDLYTLYKTAIPTLKLEKLGCPGETTGTMLNGGVCSYPDGSQLAQAVAFIKTHHVVLITIDIGANNVDGCVVNGAVNLTCVAQGIQNAETQLPEILAALKAAAPHALTVGMTYYDPFLAAWLQGSSGQALAQASVSLGEAYNQILSKIFWKFGDRVANVQRAFHMLSWKRVDGVPFNVRLTCAWTWMCAPSPVGPNIHANVLGYLVIAGAFNDRVTSLQLQRQLAG